MRKPVNPYLARKVGRTNSYILLKDCLLNIALSSACNKSDHDNIRASKIRETLRSELKRMINNFTNREILVLISELSKLLEASDEDVIRISLTLTDHMK